MIWHLACYYYIQAASSQVEKTHQIVAGLDFKFSGKAYKYRN